MSGHAHRSGEASSSVVGSPRPPPQQHLLPMLPSNEGSDADTDATRPGGRAPSPQTNTLPRPSRGLSYGSGAILSSSFGQRVPGRSFYHHASHGTSDAAQYSSQGVRETTQELASMALSDSGSFRGDTLSARLRPFETASMSRQSRDAPIDSDEFGSRTSLDSSLPEVIEETSEPVSPAVHTPTQHPRRASYGRSDESTLTRLLRSSPAEDSKPDTSVEQASTRSRSGQRFSNIAAVNANTRRPSERSSLLPRSRLSDPRQYGAASQAGSGASKSDQSRPGDTAQKSEVARAAITLLNPKRWDGTAIFRSTVIGPLTMLPAVFLGLLLNVLDALSYGMILFPLGVDAFSKTGPDGISMFYVSCIVSQVVYSATSIFRGGVGSEMIEVVPFFHKMAYTILGVVGQENAEAARATTIVSYALSSVLTGVIFFLLGLFRFGSLVSFFPRSILTGCIGGVGVFLVLTGIEVGARLEGSFEFDMKTAQHLSDPHALLLWMLPLVLSILLLTIRHFVQHPAVLPGFFVAVAALFYIVVAAAHLDLAALRDQGWIFGQVESDVPFYNFYTYYNFKLVDWSAVAQTIPTMFALSFFGVIHVPINVPALGVAVKEDDVDINRELIAHGLSNSLSGLVGSIQNYLVYVNSVFFIENGGNSRTAGLLLAAATVGVWVAGPAMIGFIPIMIVATLIYMLGIELVQEALWDTYGKVHRLEYLMILAIVLIMGLHDFVVGIVVGIILACLNYVLQTSRKSAIRASYSGVIAESTVRRHPVQRHFLREVGQQIYVTKLAGYLFFGTIVAVENKVRGLIEDESFSKVPIRYLIIDLCHVTGLDFSAAEAFSRMNRILRRRDVEMILSSVALGDEIGKSLTMVGLLDEEQGEEACPPPRVFEELNGALEACENQMLLEFKRRRDTISGKGRPNARSISVPQLSDDSSTNDALFNSPRHHLLHEAARTTFDDPNLTVNEQNIVTPNKWARFAQPHLLLLQTFQEISDKDVDFWFRASPYFERRTYSAGTVLYSRGDTPDGFYLLETGVLRVDYNLEQGTYHESIVPGTTCGELPFFGETSRSATVVAEKAVVAWCLTRQRWIELEEDPAMVDVVHELLRLGLKLTAERMNAITSYVLVMAS